MITVPMVLKAICSAQIIQKQLDKNKSYLLSNSNSKNEAKYYLGYYLDKMILFREASEKKLRGT